MLNFTNEGGRMSKFHNAYISMKKNDNSSIILFKSGMFYVLLENDARLVSSMLNLKLTKLNFDIVKCSFNINSLDKYLEIFIKNNLNIKIVNTLDGVFY